MSLADLNTLWAQANNLIDAGDYDGAIDVALKVQIGLSVTPEVSRGGNRSRSEYDLPNAAQINAFIKNCRSRAIAKRTGGSIQLSTITPTRAGLV